MGIKHIPKKFRKISNYTKAKKKYKSCDNTYSLDRFEAKEDRIERGVRVNKSGQESKNIVSIGEKKITEYLKKNKIRFTPEKVFKTCINPVTKQNLRFDFYISSLKLCIEYDGNQHYVKLKGQSVDEFSRQAYRDGLKNKWCEDNGKKLVRIKSWQLQKIDDVLDGIIKPLLNK